MNPFSLGSDSHLVPSGFPIFPMNLFRREGGARAE